MAAGRKDILQMIQDKLQEAQVDWKSVAAALHVQSNCQLRFINLIESLEDGVADPKKFFADLTIVMGRMPDDFAKPKYLDSSSEQNFQLAIDLVLDKMIRVAAANNLHIMPCEYWMAELRFHHLRTTKLGQVTRADITRRKVITNKVMEVVEAPVLTDDDKRTLKGSLATDGIGERAVLEIEAAELLADAGLLEMVFSPNNIDFSQVDYGSLGQIDLLSLVLLMSKLHTLTEEYMGDRSSTGVSESILILNGIKRKLAGNIVKRVRSKNNNPLSNDIQFFDRFALNTVRSVYNTETTPIMRMAVREATRMLPEYYSVEACSEDKFVSVLPSIQALANSDERSLAAMDLLDDLAKQLYEAALAAYNNNDFDTMFQNLHRAMRCFNDTNADGSLNYSVQVLIKLITSKYAGGRGSERMRNCRKESPFTAPLPEHLYGIYILFGQCHYHGLGVDADYSTAYEIFKSAEYDSRWFDAPDAPVPFSRCFSSFTIATLTGTDPMVPIQGQLYRSRFESIMDITVQAHSNVGLYFSRPVAADIREDGLRKRLMAESYYRVSRICLGSPGTQYISHDFFAGFHHAEKLRLDPVHATFTVDEQLVRVLGVDHAAAFLQGARGGELDAAASTQPQEDYYDLGVRLSELWEEDSQTVCYAIKAMQSSTRSPLAIKKNDMHHFFRGFYLSTDEMTAAVSRYYYARFCEDQSWPSAAEKDVYYTDAANQAFAPAVETLALQNMNPEIFANAAKAYSDIDLLSPDALFEGQTRCYAMAAWHAPNYTHRTDYEAELQKLTYVNVRSARTRVDAYLYLTALDLSADSEKVQEYLTAAANVVDERLLAEQLVRMAVLKSEKYPFFNDEQPGGKLLAFYGVVATDSIDVVLEKVENLSMQERILDCIASTATDDDVIISLDAYANSQVDPLLKLQAIYLSACVKLAKGHDWESVIAVFDDDTVAVHPGYANLYISLLAYKTDKLGDAGAAQMAVQDGMVQRVRLEQAHNLAGSLKTAIDALNELFSHVAGYPQMQAECLNALGNVVAAVNEVSASPESILADRLEDVTGELTRTLTILMHLSARHEQDSDGLTTDFTQAKNLLDQLVSDCNPATVRAREAELLIAQIADPKLLIENMQEAQSAFPHLCDRFSLDLFIYDGAFVLPAGSQKTRPLAVYQDAMTTAERLHGVDFYTRPNAGLFIIDRFATSPTAYQQYCQTLMPDATTKQSANYFAHVFVSILKHDLRKLAGPEQQPVMVGRYMQTLLRCKRFLSELPSDFMEVGSDILQAQSLCDAFKEAVVGLDQGASDVSASYTFVYENTSESVRKYYLECLVDRSVSEVAAIAVNKIDARIRSSESITLLLPYPPQLFLDASAFMLGAMNDSMSFSPDLAKSLELYQDKVIPWYALAQNLFNQRVQAGYQSEGVFELHCDWLRSGQVALSTQHHDFYAATHTRDGYFLEETGELGSLQAVITYQLLQFLSFEVGSAQSDIVFRLEAFDSYHPHQVLDQLVQLYQRAPEFIEYRSSRCMMLFERLKSGLDTDSIDRFERELVGLLSENQHYQAIAGRFEQGMRYFTESKSLGGSQRRDRQQAAINAFDEVISDLHKALLCFPEPEKEQMLTKAWLYKVMISHRDKTLLSALNLASDLDVIPYVVAGIRGFFAENPNNPSAVAKEISDYFLANKRKLKGKRPAYPVWHLMRYVSTIGIGFALLVEDDSVSFALIKETITHACRLDYTDHHTPLADSSFYWLCDVLDKGFFNHETKQDKGIKRNMKRYLYLYQQLLVHQPSQQLLGNSTNDAIVLHIQNIRKKLADLYGIDKVTAVEAAATEGYEVALPLTPEDGMSSASMSRSASSLSVSSVASTATAGTPSYYTSALHTLNYEVGFDVFADTAAASTVPAAAPMTAVPTNVTLAAPASLAATGER